MSTGYAILMDLAGNKVALKPIPKFERMKRVSARRSWMVTQRPIPSFSFEKCVKDFASLHCSEAKTAVHLTALADE
jgi:hypothetical protein